MGWALSRASRRVDALDVDAAVLHRFDAGAISTSLRAAASRSAKGRGLTNFKLFSRHHVRRVDVLLGPCNIDLRTAEAARTPIWHLCRQLAACFPHGVLPRLVRTVLPVLNEVGLRDLGQQPTRCRFKGTARHVKASRCAARALAAM
jgi:hypothetical protein